MARDHLDFYKLAVILFEQHLVSLSLLSLGIFGNTSGVSQPSLFRDPAPETKFTIVVVNEVKIEQEFVNHSKQ